METLHHLMQQSAGIGAGVTLGALVGLSIAKKRGNSKALVADSVFITAALVGFLAMAVHMLVTYLGFGQ
ncbi:MULTISPECIES: hypothetical protein [Shimia]|uniref:hypothetical protein n=1 Tax=Shimia TaxID=573139 RepID=UPI001FB56C57|nr:MULTISPECIES: hypothetical protein [Shimia]MDV4144212.1 hypothetical protein [Shimia sp. FJ5]